MYNYIIKGLTPQKYKELYLFGIKAPPLPLALILQMLAPHHQRNNT